MGNIIFRQFKNEQMLNTNHNINLVNIDDTRKYININLSINSNIQCKESNDAIMKVFDRYIYKKLQPAYDPAYQLNQLTRFKDIHKNINDQTIPKIYNTNKTINFVHLGNVNAYFNICISMSSTDPLNFDGYINGIISFISDVLRNQYKRINIIDTIQQPSFLE